MGRTSIATVRMADERKLRDGSETNRIAPSIDAVDKRGRRIAARRCVKNVDSAGNGSLCVADAGNKQQRKDESEAG